MSELLFVSTSQQERLFVIIPIVSIGRRRKKSNQQKSVQLPSTWIPVPWSNILYELGHFLFGGRHFEKILPVSWLYAMLVNLEKGGQKWLTETDTAASSVISESCDGSQCRSTVVMASSTG